ncbi:HAMP domain-containing histidine kinase [Paenibacillus doosanensis]|uniref:sensor histidine kinase n=1 Tax=Paenibacillus doosanensis TaxID=1229154 RepID=UPI00217F903C|nr:HAMP domain-containing sensor histidine kinase [Paenibacillus doosanensis]MCS7460984.1 HAMP domain-containing histidine kinase [Paenibacillus doosanensis]
MRAFKVRTVLFGSLFMISSLAWIVYVVVHLIETKSIQIGAEQGPSRIGIWLAASVGFLAAIAVFGYGFRKWIIEPLEAMGRAAGQIAEGNLDIELPPSGVREIAEVRRGFDKMAAGLRESVRQQSALEEERRFFIGAIAHDLRTPLFALRGYLEGLERNIASSPEQRNHYVKVCKQKSEQLDRLVSDLLAFAKTEHTESVQREDAFELADIVQQSLETVRHAAEAKSIALRLRMPPADAESGLVTGDAYLLERAFNNLLDNAVRHTPHGGVIEAICSLTPDKAAVTVLDSGPGIPEADLERVFEPLYRGESSRNRESGGTGLGLTIARRIFRAHGGDLTADNHPQGGARLTGWIPRTSGAESE